MHSIECPACIRLTTPRLTTILLGEPGLAGFLLDSHPYILVNIIPASHQTGEGTAVKEEEWKESNVPFRVIGAQILRPNALSVANQC